MKKIYSLLTLVISVSILSACGKSNSDAIFDPESGSHIGDWIEDHGERYISDPGICSECHGIDLRGGISKVSCFSFTFAGVSCHPSGPPVGHPAGWADPGSHGASAKDAPDATAQKGFSTCQGCHGDGFDGGGVNVSCFQSNCHDTVPPAPHGDAPWRTSGGTLLTHTNTNVLNAPVCDDCHRNDPLNPNPAPPGTAPGCFNGTLCHGTDVAGHVLPFADPVLHGPSAKSDLTFCQGCHADNPTGGAGSDPRFNVARGGLTNGCEDCHNDFTAHPSDTTPAGRESVGWFGDPWQHTDVVNRTTNCTLCHVVDPIAAGGTVGPDCRTCHALRAPLAPDDCTSCHGNPPSGMSSPNIQAAHDEHNALAVVTGLCGTCHVNAGYRTASHFNQIPEVSILSPTYDAQSGTASFSAATGICANVSCHGGQNSFAWIGTNSYDMSSNDTCLRCHESGTQLPTTNQFNSQSSGQHRLHANQGILCIECHDMVGRNALHFNGLDNKNNLGADAVNTLNLRDLVNGGNITVSSTNPVTCTGNCHNQGHNENW